jgi:predicted PurR-regulated permease PerM
LTEPSLEDLPASSSLGAAPEAGQQALNVHNVALSLLAGAAAIVLMRYMQQVLIPLALATLLFYALDPLVDWLQRRWVPRAVGAALALLIAAGCVAGIIYILQSEAAEVADQLPAGARKLRETVRPSKMSPGALAKVDEAAKELQKPDAPPTKGVVRVQVEEPPVEVGEYLWSGSMSALSLANQGVMLSFLTYFMLLTDDLFKRKLVEFVGPTLAKKRITVQILDDIAGRIQRFLMIQIVTSALVAVATGIALWLLGLEGAAFWGLMAGVFNTIPYYGPLLVTGALATVGFLQFGTFTMMAAVAGVALLITSLEGFLLTPTLMGKAAEMNRVAMFAGLLFWTWMWGIPGMLLAVPLMMAIKVVCDRVEDLQPVGRFLGD